MYIPAEDLDRVFPASQALPYYRTFTSASSARKRSVIVQLYEAR